MSTVACGYGHTAILNQDDECYVWGRNHHSQLGLGDSEDRHSPTLLSPPGGVPFSMLAAGAWYTVAINKDGHCYGWGNNHDGELGLGDGQTKTVPTLLTIPDGIPFTAISSGFGHCIALNENKQCYVWGSNWLGQLGLGGDYECRIFPPRLLNAPDGVPFKTVRCGGSCSVANNEDGQWYAWGCNRYGELGLGVEDHILTPRLIQNHNFIKVLPTGWCSAGITSDDIWYVWGKNEYGQLGLGHKKEVGRFPSLLPAVSDDSLKYITGGDQYSVGVTTMGTVYVWGRNQHGQLGVGNTADCDMPVQLSEQFAWVFCGWYSCIGTKDDGTCYVWGRNEFGQLGLGTKTDCNIPTLLSLPKGIPWKNPHPEEQATHFFEPLMDDSFFSTFIVYVEGQIGITSALNKNPRR